MTIYLEIQIKQIETEGIWNCLYKCSHCNMLFFYLCIMNLQWNDQEVHKAYNKVSHWN